MGENPKSAPSYPSEAALVSPSRWVNPKSPPPPSSAGGLAPFSRSVNPKSPPPSSPHPSAPPLSLDADLAPLSKKLNPRRPPTAMTNSSGGLAGGVDLERFKLTPRYQRYLHRRPPSPLQVQIHTSSKVAFNHSRSMTYPTMRVVV